MSLNKRYMEFQKKKNRILAQPEPEAMFLGGEVDEDDYNEHLDDTSGEPSEYDTANGFAFGGKIEAPEHGDEGHPEMSLEQVHAALGQALMRRKQLKPGA